MAKRKSSSKAVADKNGEYSNAKLYSKKHVWALKQKNNTALVGVTDYITDELASIDNIDMPMVGDELEMEAFCLHLHVGSRIHHVRAPLSGRVLEINKEIEDTPCLIHINPNDTWLFKMEYDDEGEMDLLLSGDQYAKFLDQL